MSSDEGLAVTDVSVMKGMWYIFTMKHMLKDENDISVNVVHSISRKYA